MKKITAKSTKQELKDFLGANILAVKKVNKDLYDQMVYADKMLKKDESKVTVKDLLDLARESLKILGESAVFPTKKVAVENSTKKLTKKVKEEPKEEIAEEPMVEIKAVEEEPKVEEEKPAKAKKSLGKKKEQPKKDGVVALEENSNKAIQMAKMFPATLQVGDETYKLAPEIKTMEDLYTTLQDGEKEVVFAYYWTKRHLKQFNYFGNLLGQPKSFDNDLDLATAIYVSDEKKVSYQVSMYTEAFYTVLPEHLEEENGIRIAGGIEFQIYIKE